MRCFQRVTTPNKRKREMFDLVSHRRSRRRNYKFGTVTGMGRRPHGEGVTASESVSSHRGTQGFKTLGPSRGSVVPGGLVVPGGAGGPWV